MNTLQHKLISRMKLELSIPAAEFLTRLMLVYSKIDIGKHGMIGRIAYAGACDIYQSLEKKRINNKFKRETKIKLNLSTAEAMTLYHICTSISVDNIGAFENVCIGDWIAQIHQYYELD